jgi:transcriptional regulator with XRE-family HTH domain
MIMTKSRLIIHSQDNVIKRLRKSNRLSQEQLASKIGVAVSTIRRWERGDAEPTMTVEQMEQFCMAVNQEFTKLPKKLASGFSINSR